MTLMEKVNEMIRTFEPEDREEVAKLILAANDYVRGVSAMLAENRNYFNRTGEELRTAKEEADQTRRRCHNAFIDRTNMVNRMCASYQLEPIYTGGEARREYGDFAMALVTAMFESR